MNGYNRLINSTRNNFFGKVSEIDDETFHFWKDELQKELPSFWEEIIEKP